MNLQSIINIDVDFYNYIRDRQKTKHNIGITLVAIK